MKDVPETHITVSNTISARDQIEANTTHNRTTLPPINN